MERDGVESFGSSDDSRPQSWDITSCAGSNVFEEDMVRQVDGRCPCSGDNERAIKRDKDVSESQIPAVGPAKGSAK